MNMTLNETPYRRRLWILFREFFCIALFVVGGGFAILLVAEQVFVRKRQWLRAGELTDMLALIQTVPGLTAGNIAIYVGHRVAGFPGALLALFAVALPSFIVITLVAVGFDFLPMDNVLFRGAFIGVRTAMAGLTLVVIFQIWRGSVRNKTQLTLCVLGTLAVLFFHLNPGWLILAGLLFGVIYGTGLRLPLPEPEDGAEMAGAPPRGERDGG
ncbi:MAG: chromate transporter [Victivallaceae bacterium]|nr:chromate transporter [Victivallaceae bacterium]